MANKRKPMDKLTIISLAAQKEGLSYGKYMTKYNYDPPCLRQPQELLYTKPEIPENLETSEPVKWEKQCPVCGKRFPSGTRRVYCSKGCYAKNASDRQKTRRAEGKEQRYCAICGNPLPLSSDTRRRCCSKACSAALYHDTHEKWDRESRRKKRNSQTTEEGGITP